MTPEALEQVEAFFWENFTRRGELGASLSVWHHGREVLSLAGGHCDAERTVPWSAETPVLVWSATKGPASACVLHALARHGEPLNELLHAPVAAFWPEFAQAGKARVSVAELLSHRAALAALDRPVSALDHAAVAEALAAQPPNWPLGEKEKHGYHPRTFGSLLDELLRRIEGMPLGEYWHKWFALPLGLDFWIGAPPEALPRIAPVYPSRTPPGSGTDDADFFRAFGDPGSLTARAFRSPRGVESISAMNTPALRQASLPGFGGIGTAHALAKFYAMLAEGGALEGLRFFDSVALAPMSTTLTSGRDRVLLRQTAFSAGFMRDPVDLPENGGQKLRQLFGPSFSAFGQPGAGGSHAFADPENGIAFAYVMNQMETGVMPGLKATGLVEALYSLAAH